MVKVSNGSKPFTSKPGNRMGTWDLHIYYTVFIGDYRSAETFGVCIGD